MSDTRRKILDLMRRKATPMGPKDIARAIEEDENKVWQMLQRLVESGQVRTKGRGKYEATKAQEDLWPK
jgi:DNA-binding IclR family transcriptional regulator